MAAGVALTDQLDVGVAAVPLSSLKTCCRDGVTVSGLYSNTASIYLISDSSYAYTRGFELRPGQPQFIPIADLANFWLISSAASQRACYLAR